MKSFIILSLLFIPLFLTAQTKDSIPAKDTSGLQKTQQLSELILVGKRGFIEQQLDKTVLNVQNDVLAVTSNLFQILQSAPGVSITQDENIQMNGKTGVNVLIDGRPSQLSARDLADWLKSTPGANVDKIEIISQPSSKYPAQGNAGIINIRMKRLTKKGFNGSVSTSYTQSVHGNGNASTNLNFRKEKWNWFGNVSARKSRQNTDGAIVRYVNSDSTAKIFVNNTVDQDASRNLAFEIGADHYLSSKHILGFIIKANEYSSKLHTPGTTFIQSNLQTDSSLSTINDHQQQNSRYSYNFNYRYEDSLGNELNIDADYATFTNHSSGFVETDLFDNNFTKYGYTANAQNVNTAINIYGIKMDYQRQLKKLNSSVELGWKLNKIETNNDLRTEYFNNSIFVADTGRSNVFDYSENIYAAYVSLSSKFKKWEYKFGGRLEYAGIDGTSTNLKGAQVKYPDTSYLNFFPTMYVSYKVNASHNFSGYYGRRINRPGYQELNPFEYIYDNYSSERGNPFLLPEFTKTVSLSYSYKYALQITAGYSVTKNFFQTVVTQKGERTEAMNFNIGEEKRFYVEAGISVPITKWWSSYSNLSPRYNAYSGTIPEGELKNKAWAMGWYTSHRFSLPEKWNLQLSSWGSIATKDAISKTAWLGSVDIAGGKSFLKERLSLRASVTDIFDTQRWQQRTAIGNVQFTYLRKWESRTFTIQVGWKLGKTNYKARERKMGAQEEMDRIK